MLIFRNKKLKKIAFLLRLLSDRSLRLEVIRLNYLNLSLYLTCLGNGGADRKLVWGSRHEINDKYDK